MSDLAISADRDAAWIGAVGFEKAFEVRLKMGAATIERTPHGDRILRKILGGIVTGRIEGTVYPLGGGDYSLRRSDGVIDLNSHVMLRDAKGEWLYLHNIGYERTDGYWRVTSWVDVDAKSEHSWVLGLFFVGRAYIDKEEEIVVTYFEVT